MPAEKRRDKKSKEDDIPVTLSGVYVFANGDKYDGNYVKLADGSIERTGIGAHFSHDGQVYRGSWECDKMLGLGRMELANGALYEGDFVNNKYHGIGRYSWPNGSYYKGQFNENKIEGEGVFTDEDGQQWTGIFRYKAAPGLRFKLKPLHDVESSPKIQADSSQVAVSS